MTGMTVIDPLVTYIVCCCPPPHIPLAHYYSGTDLLAPALMTLDTAASMGAAAGSSGSSSRLSTPGCAILGTLLLQYQRKVAKPFVASVVALSSRDAARAAKDPAGSRALQVIH
jgi:hypothetical protein